MLQLVRHIVAIAACVVACGCNSVDFKGMFMPTGDGVQARFEQSMEINDNLHAENQPVNGSYTFYVAADPHIENTSRNLDAFNDILKNDKGASFGVILGDCTEIRDNIGKYLSALAYTPDRHSCNQKIFHILGNHDLFFNGWEDFKQNIGASVYWFEAVFAEGKDLFISLDTATGTLGRKQTEWFRSFLENNRQKYRHCIIMTHTNFFYTDNSQTGSGNMPLEECFSLIDFLGRQKVSLVLQGHDHYREALTYDKVRYTILGTIRDEAKAPEYMKVKVSDDGISPEWIRL